MTKKGDVLNNEFQFQLEEAVLNYQTISKSDNKIAINDAYNKIINLYNPMDYYHSWYDQYKYLYDSQDDFIADYLRVFILVILGWKPRSQRKKSRYGGSGEFKNYFIGSLYHNFINMVKSDQASKRNLTKRCPICQEWVNPISTHLIIEHSYILWDYLKEMNINIEELDSCPFCPTFKIKSNKKDNTTELIKAHFISKHTSLLFNKFNELFPDVSTISPKIISSCIEEGDEELDVYDVIEDEDNLLHKLEMLDLSDIQLNIINQILNGDMNIVYKPDKFDCTKEEWDSEMDQLKEVINIYRNEYR